MNSNFSSSRLEDGKGRVLTSDLLSFYSYQTTFTIQTPLGGHKCKMEDNIAQLYLNCFSQMTILLLVLD